MSLVFNNRALIFYETDSCIRAGSLYLKYTTYKQHKHDVSRSTKRKFLKEDELSLYICINVLKKLILKLTYSA